MAMLATAAGQIGLQMLMNPTGTSMMMKCACNTIGTIYPIYQSFKMIEQNHFDEVKFKKWMNYWAIYSGLSLIETILGSALSWFPLYYHGKLALLIWLQIPMFEGAQKLYVNYVRPVFLRYQPKIDYIGTYINSYINSFIVNNRVQIDMATAAARNFMRLIQEFFDWFNTNDEQQGDNNANTSGNSTLISNNANGRGGMINGTGSSINMTSPGSEASASSSITDNN